MSLHRVAAAATLLGAQLGASAQQTATPDAAAAPERGKLPTVTVTAERWIYRSKINFFLYESVEFTGKPLTEGGLRAGYLWGRGKYEAAAFVRNLTNQIRVVGGIDFNNLTGFINEPRTYGLQFKALF